MKKKGILSFFRSNKVNLSGPMDPDEVFLDSSNLPQFDTFQFEGRIETPISKDTIVLLAIFFLTIAFIFLYRVGNLQIVHGAVYADQSEDNRLSHILIFPERGVIYDRNSVELAWNIPGEEEAVPSRAYIQKPGLSHILGYVSYPLADNKGVYYSTEYIGNDGIELQYNHILNGEGGLMIVETDALYSVQSENVVQLPKDGDDITLTIDSRVQSKMFEFMVELADEKDFQGGSGVIMNIHNGEILAMTNFPEYNSAILSEGEDADTIARYVQDINTPFLNRAVAGNYTPGSIVKPVVVLGALQENVISPQKNILSTGSISIDNPYNPELKTVFTDWKAHGWVDAKKALAVSSNVYMYVIAGGYQDQRGLGIERLEKYVRMFGLGGPTGVDIPGEAKGVIPSPEWKKIAFDGDDWRIGDTYNTAIGQYGFQVTPIQMARAIGAIAADGVMQTPHVVLNETSPGTKVDVDDIHLRTVRQGMRQAVTSGTAQGLNVPQVLVAAKTGTAEVGISKARVNAWIVGFFPYDNPKYSFAIMMEKGPRDNLVGGLYVMRQMLDWMEAETPEYLES